MKKIPTGKGHGHTGFIKVDDHWIALAVNHNDLYVTLIDTINLEVLERITVSQTPASDVLTQGHTTGALDGKFYMMVSHEATFIEIDVVKRQITRKLDLNAVDKRLSKILPLQGTFLWENKEGYICTNCV